MADDPSKDLRNDLLTAFAKLMKDAGELQKKIPRTDALESGDDAESPAGVINSTAIYADTYWVSLWKDQARITFGEYLDGEARYRMAVVVPVSVIADLHKTLMGMVERWKVERDADGNVIKKSGDGSVQT